MILIEVFFLNLVAQIRDCFRKKTLWQTVAFGIPFCILCYFGLMEYAETRYCLTDTLFVFGLAVFAVMVVEDWRDSTVDVRWTAVLLVLLLFTSKQPAGNFIVTGFAAFLFFRIVFVLSALIRLRWCSCKKEQCIIQIDGRGEKELYLAYLPSFGGALVAYSFATMLYNAPAVFLQQFEDGFVGIWDMVPTSLMVGIIVSLLTIWGIIEAIFRFAMKRFPEEMKAGIGMGDVIVLPIFAAFLGISAFTLVLFLSCFIHIGIVLCRNYIHLGV